MRLVRPPAEDCSPVEVVVFFHDRPIDVRLLRPPEGFAVGENFPADGLPVRPFPLVRCAIAGTGVVAASVVEDSTIESVAVERCIAQAALRWSFPSPAGGGIARVSYPFALAPAGGSAR